MKHREIKKCFCIYFDNSWFVLFDILILLTTDLLAKFTELSTELLLNSQTQEKPFWIYSHPAISVDLKLINLVNVDSKTQMALKLTQNIHNFSNGASSYTINSIDKNGHNSQ